MTQMVARSNGPHQSDPSDVDDFMLLIGDALGMNETTQDSDRADSYEPELADMAPLQAEEQTAAPLELSPSSDIVAAYGTLLGLFGATLRASVSTDFVCKLQIDFPFIFSTDAASVPSDGADTAHRRRAARANALAHQIDIATVDGSPQEPLPRLSHPGSPWLLPRPVPLHPCRILSELYVAKLHLVGPSSH
eukprot:5329547-Prymnesium_polylepis.1